MSADGAPGAKRRGGRLQPRLALAGALATLALLLFCWPFVSVPPPTLPAACGHVFGSWAAAIALLWGVSRGFGRERGGDGDG